MSLFLALLGIIAIGTGQVIMAHKIAGLSPFIAVPIYAGFVSITTFGIGRVVSSMGHAVPFSVGDVLPWLVLLALLASIGDLAYFGAYNVKGASMATITTCAALLPIIANCIEKVCIGGELPSLRTMCGFGLAVFTVWVVAFDPANIPIKP